MRLIQEATEENKQTLVLARDVSSDCSGALSDARSALREYSSLDASHSIVYLGDDNDCDDVASDIGDISETRTEALEEATSFSASSTTTVSRLAAYSKARSAYDAQYLANKTESVREAVAAMVDTIVVPFVE